MKKLIAAMTAVIVICSAVSCKPEKKDEPQPDDSVNSVVTPENPDVQNGADLAKDSENATQDGESTNSNNQDSETTDNAEVLPRKDLSSDYIRIMTDDSKPVTGLYPVSRYSNEIDKSLYGLIDSNGKLVAPIKYDVTYPSSEGYAVVSYKSDRKGTDILGQTFDVGDEICAYVNIKGEECLVIKKDYYYTPGDFHEGVALIYIETANSTSDWTKYAIDAEGNILYSWPNEDVLVLYDFSDGMARFRSEEGLYGYLDKDFNIAIEAAYEEADDFHEGRAAVMIDDKLAYIDKTGNVVIQTNEPRNEYGFMTYGLENSRYWGNYEYYEKWRFSEGLAGIYEPIDPETWERPDENTRHRYIDKDGNTVIEGISGSKFSNGLAVFVQHGEDAYNVMGYMNRNGEVVIPAKYNLAFPFNEYGVAYVAKDAIDLPSEYRGIDSTYYLCGYINTKGEEIIPLEYCTIGWHYEPKEANGILELYKEGYTYFFNTEGQLLGKIVQSEYKIKLYEELLQGKE